MRKRNHSPRHSPLAKSRRRRRLIAESLEQRSLMAADIGLADGYIQIHGSDQNDVAEIHQQEDQVIVSYSQFSEDGQLLGERQDAFPRGEVRGIFFQGKRGDDVLVNDSNIPVAALGGPGNDMFFGGSANDLLAGGCGDDVLFGSEGNDILLGGAGDNVLLDSSGAELLPPIEEFLPDEPVPAENSDETSPVDGLTEDTPLIEETIPADETVAVNESVSTDEPIPAEDTPPVEETVPVDEVAPVEIEPIVAVSETEVSENTPPDMTLPEDDCEELDEPTPPVAANEAIVESVPVETVPAPEATASEESPLADEPAASSDGLNCELAMPVLVASDDNTADPVSDSSNDMGAVAFDEIESATPIAETFVEDEAKPSIDNDILVGGTGSDLLFGAQGDDWLFGDECPPELLAQLTLNQFSWYRGSAA